MLTISPELAQTFETATLQRWKSEITAELRRLHTDAAAGFSAAELDDWVRSAMDSLRRLGGTSRGDIAFFVVTLFAMTEAAKDPRAIGDLVAIMGSAAPYPAKMALLRQAF